MTLQNHASAGTDKRPQAGLPDILAPLTKRPPAKDDITACLAAYDDIAPLLRALVTDAANGAVMSEADVITLNNGLFLLAVRRDIQTCRPLLRLLALTKHHTGLILRRTRSALQRIISSVFDGDHDALFALACDRSLEPRIRSEAMQAATYLALKGAIARDAIHAFLTSFPVNDAADDTADDHNIVVGSWMIAIALLAMRDLAPLVYHRMTIGDFGFQIANRPDFERRLESAEKDPTNAENLEIFDSGEIDDVVFELTTAPWFFDGETESESQAKEDRTRPIEDIVVELLTARYWDRAIINACMDRMAQAAPLLRAEVARAAAAERLSPQDSLAFYRSLYVLGLTSDRRTFQPLLRLLRRPSEQLGHVLKPLFLDLSRIIISVFDWNAEPLFSLLADRSTDSLLRINLIMATAFLTFEGRIPRDRMLRCLGTLDVDSLSDDDKFDMLVLEIWVRAIATLGLRELAPLVERKLDAPPRAALQKLSKDGHSANSYFQFILTKAEQNPHDDEILYEFGGHIADIMDMLTTHPDPRLCITPASEEPGPALQRSGRPRGRVKNPMRNVGRNDPCPCGSGLKAKKCCLANKQ